MCNRCVYSFSYYSVPPTCTPFTPSPPTHTHWLTPSASPFLTPHTLTLLQPLPHPSHPHPPSLIPHILTLHTLTPHPLMYFPYHSHHHPSHPHPLTYILPKPSHSPSPLTSSSLTPSHLTHSPQRSDHHLLRQLSKTDPLGGVSEGVWKNNRVHLPQRAQL